jgi:outer membrane protein assembly factor BamE (lipoprotein component of BamABCDE complex)
MNGILDRGAKANGLSSGVVRRLTKLSVAVALAAGLAGCLGYDGSVQHGYVLDQRQLEQVKTGASAQQVLTILGTPSTTSTVGGDAWYYITQKTERKVQFMEPKVVDQRVLAVYFDKGKRVQRVANYGLEDGQPIDLISRTTPTGGTEQSFVMNALKGLLRF